MFPDLEPFEIDRMRRFGECRVFEPGDKLFTAGKVGPGLIVIPCGKVQVTRDDGLGNHHEIVTHGPGQFLGELAQMAGRPSLADATALETVRSLIISPDRLRALLVAEADLGERIMRALILRRVGTPRTRRRRADHRRARRERRRAAAARAFFAATAIRIN